MGEETCVTEVPSALTKLARLVVRGFYSIEDTLIIDMLVRNPCMKEDDICELLKFEKKMLRARIATLKNDKFIQVRLRMETGEDGKAQKVNYYFINYKTFVNVVKYKLDLMRKRMETEERDATSRASFKCPKCAKTFTDLEADQLFDPVTGEFVCTYCREVVEEDLSALPKKDCRMQMARFNSQMEPVFDLLRQVEGIKLAPEILEPEPVDINAIRGIDSRASGMATDPSGRRENWTNDATRSQGLIPDETRVAVTIDDESRPATAVVKETPVWMVDSTVITTDESRAEPMEVAPETEKTPAKNGDDIMSVLLAHERRGAANTPGPGPDPGSDSSDGIPSPEISRSPAEVEIPDSEEEDMAPTVLVGNRAVSITEVNDELISQMTPQEKETYIQVYQEYYSHMYD